MRKQLHQIFSVLTIFISLSLHAQVGQSCSNPIVISGLPFQTVGNTFDYGDTADQIQGTLCGANPEATNYMAGNDVFFSYTPTVSKPISIKMTPGKTYSSIFVYAGCSTVGASCIGGVANFGITTRTVNINAVAGQNYIIVISSSALNQTIPYELLIQEENCLYKPTNGIAFNQTTSGATLSWENPGGYSSFQVEVQPLGSLVPSGTGSDTVSSTSLVKTGLEPGIQYQYWVRAECTANSGIFTSWAGPYPFQTVLCNPANTCSYTFRLTDSGFNGWSTNRMQVRQNGIVVATLGSQLPTGGGPVDVTVPMCANLPFDIFWSETGSFPGQCGLSVFNEYGQNLYTKPSNLSAVNTVLFSGVAKCGSPQCDVLPTNLQAQSVTTTGATLSWSSPALTSFEIYLAPANSPAPTSATAATYSGTSADNMFVISNSLTPDFEYSFYVRIPCSPSAAWAGPYNFVTQQSCYKPSLPVVENITTNSATFSWTNVFPSDNKWEILLIPSIEYLPYPGPNPPLTNGTLLFATTDPSPYTVPAQSLTPATIYSYYVRTVCSENDKSSWTGPIRFNTITCDAAQKCNYKFVLANANTNSWNGARMQVKQNGILITTLGSTSINNSNGIMVPLCNNVPFELVWSVEGTTPEAIQVKVFNSYGDEVYVKAPQTGSPLTTLYSATVNCNPPSCIKPLALTASEVTATSAKIGWDSPGDSLYDLYVVPAGAPAPINFPASTPTISGVPNPYVLTQINGQPLAPSTTYTFYVRKVCAPGDKSTWTNDTPLSFTTTPLNDECSAATTVLVSNNQNCSVSIDGNTIGATASLPLMDPPLVGTGCGSVNKDVWFKFIATKTAHSILLNATTVGTTLNYSIFSGDCNGLTKIGCYTTPYALFQNLTVGQLYYLRVYTTQNTLSASFKLCIASPPVNDECSSAISATVNPSMFVAQELTGSTLGASASGNTVSGTACPGTDDDVWYTFTATSVTHIINLTLSDSSSSTVLNHSIYQGDCATLTTMYCAIATQSVASGLIPGTTYKIRVFTSGTIAGRWASFKLSVTTPPVITNDNCDTATQLTVNQDTACQNTTFGSVIGATASLVTSGCIGVKDDDVWYRFTALSQIQMVNLLDISGVLPNLNHAIYSGNCGNLTSLICSAQNATSSRYNNYIPGQTYYLRVWSNAAIPQINTFSVCIKTIPSCQNASEFCGSSPDDPYVFPNITGVSDNTDIACLATIPNPAFYTLRVNSSGSLLYEISQFESFDIYGEPIGQGLDVDYVAWGPFSSTESCDLISMATCPSCPNNTLNPNFYPFGNIVDCSYSINAIETLSIPNAVAGEIYIILITNYEDDFGFIKLTQTNFNAPGAGTTSCADKIQLIAFVDQNNNGTKEVFETTFKYGNFIYQKNNTGASTNVSSTTGKYNIYDSNPANTYDFSYSVFPEYSSYYSLSATAFNDLSIPTGSGTQSLYFPVTLTTPYSDVAVSIVPLQQARAGFSYTNRLIYKNLGPGAASGTINYTKDPLVNITVNAQAVTITPQGFTYEFSDLPGYGVRTIDIICTVPSIPVVNINDVLVSSAVATPPQGDIDINNNTFTSSQTVVASYDPNDKMEAHGETIRLNEFTTNDYLNYTIRFQNTGTYYAETVRVEDILDSQFDETSIRVESTSHPYIMQRIGNKVIWTFENIHLPSTIQNEDLSHGYISFKIKLKPGFAVGDIVPNKAFIFFDSNPAIITNTFETAFELPMSTPDFNAGHILIYPNPAKSQIEISMRNTNEVLESIVLYDVLGKIVKRSAKMSSVSSSLNVSDLAKGMYLVEITTANHLKRTKKLVIN